MLREAAVLAALLGLVLAVFVFVWAPHKALVVKRNHFFLKLFALFDLPPWLCRKIVPKTPARTFQGVTSSDHVFTSARDQRWAEPMSCVLVHLLTNQRWNQYRLYVPADEVDPRDALLWVHGGGFVLGSITEFQIDGACRTMAARSRMRVISVEYRKTPEFSLMAGRRDVEQAVLSAAQNYSRVVLGGESAGATLALSVAIKHPEKIRHLLLVYPGLEHGIDDAKYADSWILDATVMAWFRSHHGTIEERDKEEETLILEELLKEADTHLDIVARLPSTHIISAGLDPLHLGSTKLEEKMRRAGVVVQHDHFPESDHGFFSFGIDQSEEGIVNAVSRMRHTLQNETRES